MPFAFVASGSKEIPPPPEGASPQEWSAHVEAEAAKALEEGYWRMHYVRPTLRVDVRLRRPIRRCTVASTVEAQQPGLPL